MITQWDIISNIDSQSNSILYSLLIDGTEQDARLIAKKLQGYVQSPQPAMAPYVYRFPLPEDLDEDTVEKIRTAVREGIEQAKKVNEFIPGGSFGNTLFNENVVKEDKAFPTFLTLDPSASFFQAPEPQDVSSVNISVPEVDAFQHRQINLDLTETFPPSVSQPAVTEDTPPQEAVLQEEPPKAPAEVVKEEVFVSEPSLVPTQNFEDNLPKIKTISLDEQEIPAENVAEPAQEEPAVLPLTDKDMLNKDIEGTLLDQSLEDIFSAETKYDMFLDLEKLAPPNEQKAAQEKQVQQEKEKGLSLEKQTLSAPDMPPAQFNAEEDSFNIFDQKIKDQTCFVDLDDVKQITERITQKDMAFVEHAQLTNTSPDVIEKPLPPLEEAKEEKPSAPAKKSLSIAMPFSRFERQNDKQEEVLDPFEQMLASASAKKEEASAESSKLSQQETSVAQEVGPVPPLPKPLPPAEKVQEESTVPQKEENTPAEQEPLPQPDILSGQTEREERVIPPPAAPITERNIMSENTGDKKPILRIKRKAQEPVAPPAPVAAPLPPVPAAPSAPVASATPQIPAPVPPVPVSAEEKPATPPVQEVAPVTEPAPKPQEEHHHTILRRRRPSAHTILEKTRTIDHSIELPLSELKKHNWPLEVPLIPTYTLENMTISVNRFAHATAISVIDNPGKLYNPLVLHGASGTGKTHFLHAIGYALSKKFGQENIFITNGVRLSRGIQRYVMEGNIEKFEEFANNAKAILIDDIHLIAVNEQNRAHLSKLLNDFRNQHKQIVVTSKYPPESLAKLEELLNFKLDSGWISELKDATGKTRTKIIQRMLLSNNINISDEDAERFFGKPNMSLGTVNRAIRRVRVLERLIFPQLPPERRSSKDIFEQLLATSGEDRSSQVAIREINEISNAPVTGNGEWGRIGFFYPQNSSNMMNWLVFALQQRAKELGIPGGPELSVRSSYSTDNIISSAFKIANLCDNKKLKGAVILGPELDVCESSVRENFYDILTHMLEIMLIRCGVINYENVNAPSTYVKILSELLR
ncbi:MAG: ATP-binding protein [Elusimicrobiaceae bacterium]|nr:ATP-binding protein [Elusimicrobiaceae bacterium]